MCLNYKAELPWVVIWLFYLRGRRRDIEWSSPSGFGVKLNEMTAQHGDLLKTYVNQKD